MLTTGKGSGSFCEVMGKASDNVCLNAGCPWQPLKPGAPRLRAGSRRVAYTQRGGEKCCHAREGPAPSLPGQFAEQGPRAISAPRTSPQSRGPAPSPRGRSGNRCTSSRGTRLCLTVLPCPPLLECSPTDPVGPAGRPTSPRCRQSHRLSMGDGQTAARGSDPAPDYFWVFCEIRKV